MTINSCIDQIKKMAGLNGILKGTFPDTLIYDSIINNTLKTFNRYSGFTIKTTSDTLFETWNKVPVDSSLGLDIEIIVPPEYLKLFEELGSEILGVRMEKRSVYPMSGLVMSRGMKDDLLMYAGNQMARANWDHPKAQWRAPNTIYIKDWGYSSYQVPLAYNLYLRCTHPKNLSTITAGLEQMFMELAYYDLMMNIWNNDLRLMRVQTGQSEVDLNLENFSNAESKREELIEKIRKKAGYDSMVLEF